MKYDKKKKEVKLMAQVGLHSAAASRQHVLQQRMIVFDVLKNKLNLARIGCFMASSKRAANVAPARGAF